MAALVFAAYTPAAAQDLPAAAPAGERVLAAVPLAAGDEIRLDGVPDEPVWERARPATDFIQRDPDNGAPATERTEVRVVYDADRVVLGVWLYDSEPQRLLGNQMQRDQSFSADDRFMWTIDTFLDRRGGYFFEINPAGAMGDGLIDPSRDHDTFGVAFNKSWDGIWTARVQRSNAGWTAEVEIPLKTLNFDPGAQAWGINFQRTVRRKNEESLWTGFTRNQGLNRMSNAGRVTGLAGLSQGLGLDLRPYLVGTTSSAPGRGSAGTVAAGDIGLDAFYNVTPALRANLSVNTDFAETEVDQRRVNLTRFPLFFEEKRTFFLEGSSYFDFGREVGNSVRPFFSRRVGLTPSGTPQRIDFGAKVTGQAAGFDVGVLQVRTGEDDGLAGEDFTVTRVRRRAFRQSYVGMIYTRRDARGGAADPRQTAGVDFDLRTSTFRGTQNLAFNGMYLWTSNPLGTGENAGYALRLDYPNNPWGARMYVRELQRNYDPAVGFVERRGIRRIGPVVEWYPRPRRGIVRNFHFEINTNFTNDAETNEKLTRQHQLISRAIFHSGDRVEFEVTPSYERLEDDFEIFDGVVLPLGATYDFTRYRLLFESSDSRLISVAPEIDIGTFFSGRRQQYSTAVNLRPRRGVLLTAEVEHNALQLAEGSFDTDVYRLRANTQFSPWLSLANNLQYDSVSQSLGWQMRFRWIQRPGNDLFLVYTRNWQEQVLTPQGAASFETLDSRLATKLVYTLRF